MSRNLNSKCDTQAETFVWFLEGIDLDSDCKRRLGSCEASEDVGSRVLWVCLHGCVIERCNELFLVLSLWSLS